MKTNLLILIMLTSFSSCKFSNKNEIVIEGYSLVYDNYDNFISDVTAQRITLHLSYHSKLPETLFVNIVQNKATLKVRLELIDNQNYYSYSFPLSYPSNNLLDFYKLNTTFLNDLHFIKYENEFNFKKSESFFINYFIDDKKVSLENDLKYIRSINFNKNLPPIIDQ